MTMLSVQYYKLIMTSLKKTRTNIKFKDFVTTTLFGFGLFFITDTVEYMIWSRTDVCYVCYVERNNQR